MCDETPLPDGSVTYCNQRLIREISDEKPIFIIAVYQNCVKVIKPVAPEELEPEERDKHLRAGGGVFAERWNVKQVE